jgi:hypothetical protein
MKTDILEINIVDKSSFMKYWPVIVNYYLFKSSQDREVNFFFFLESEENENCTNGKPSHTLPQGVPKEVKRMRKDFIREAHMWRRLF